MRQVPSGGTAQFRAVAPGADGVQQPEFSPAFANAPDLQDGPRADAAAPDAASRALSSARKRMVNRSIAKSRGRGEAVIGEERFSAAGALPGNSFDGLSMRDTRLADGGNSFSVEPPDQGLCVGNGFVVESVNDAIRVFDRRGSPLTGVASLNTFYGYPVAIDRTRGHFGPVLTDPGWQLGRFRS